MAMRRAAGWWALVLLAAGCDAPHLLPAPDEPEVPVPAVSPSSRFDAATAGTVQGRVCWRGAIPSVPPISFPLFQPGNFSWETRPNPNAPDIDPDGRTVRGAAVFLRGVDPVAARPWDLPPVRIELADLSYRVLQRNKAAGHVGFVHRGDAVEFVSCEQRFHAARGRGAAFFSLMLPDPNQSTRHVLDRPGVVELTSSAGYFWMQAYLFVDEHPYYALTDSQGRFTLSGVPPGQYELVAWQPSWRVIRQERDPESGQIARQFYAPPLTAVQTVEVASGGVCETALTLGERE